MGTHWGQTRNSYQHWVSVLLDYFYILTRLSFVHNYQLLRSVFP